MITREVYLDGAEEAQALFGPYDENLRAIEKRYPVRVVARGDAIRVSGRHRAAVAAACRAIEEVLQDLRRAERNRLRPGPLPPEEREKAEEAGARPSDEILVSHRGRSIQPRTPNQKTYLEQMRKSDITVAIGPAGTGKSFLAVAFGIRMLREGKFSRIVLSRPVVEAGERLGFLPGDFLEKVDPYLRPLYDAFWAMVGPQEFGRMRSDGTVEVVPLAFMRGRTLEDAFIILDEAQNTTPEQMKMFLTRLGVGSRAVITGDVTQIDLDRGALSGLIQCEKILARIPGIAIVRFTEEDVLRHGLVKEIIRAWDLWERKQRG